MFLRKSGDSHWKLHPLLELQNSTMPSLFVVGHNWQSCGCHLLDCEVARVTQRLRGLHGVLSLSAQNRIRHQCQGFFWPVSMLRVRIMASGFKSLCRVRFAAGHPWIGCGMVCGAESCLSGGGDSSVRACLCGPSLSCRQRCSTSLLLHACLCACVHACMHVWTHACAGVLQIKAIWLLLHL